MRCSCQICGTYMVQRERGLSSGCVCPECFAVCTKCTTLTGGAPLSPEELKLAFAFRQSPDGEAEADPLIGPIRPEEYID